MSDYTKLTNYAVKDGYTTGNPAKVIKGTELDDEFNAISVAIATKVDSTDTIPLSSLSGLGTGIATALAVNIGTNGAPVIQGNGLGTPASGNLTNCTVDGTNKPGYRIVPAVGAKTSSYTLALADVGKYVEIGTGGSIVIPDGVFSNGDIISLFNNTTGDVTITCSITTAYISGTDADKATVTLSTRGIATVLFISGTLCVISGSVK